MWGNVCLVSRVGTAPFMNLFPICFVNISVRSLKESDKLELFEVRTGFGIKLFPKKRYKMFTKYRKPKDAAPNRKLDRAEFRLDREDQKIAIAYSEQPVCF